jgi:DNA-binding GntR family transcriptional regulator
MNDMRTRPAREPALAALLAAYKRAAAGGGSKKSNLIDAFIRSIEQGLWQPGDRLPTESELAAALPVSLGTVQGALTRLAEAGLVQRKAGVGTHVTNLSAREGDRWFMRFLADGDEGFLATEVLRAAVTENDEPGPWTAFLGDPTSLVKVSRLVRIGGRFNVLALAYLEGVRFRPLLDFDLAVIGDLHIRQILHDRFNAPTLARSTRIRFLALADDVACDLEAAPGSMGLALDVASTTAHGRPLCFQRFVIPPNDCALDVKRD